MKQEQKNQATTAAALLAILYVGQAQAGLKEWIVTTVWNYFIFTAAVGPLFSCWYLGFWGLFWDGDEGALQEICLQNMGAGATVTFPVEYSFNWANTTLSR